MHLVSIIIRVLIIIELSVYGDKFMDCSKVVVVAGLMGPPRGRREPIGFTQAINSEDLDFWAQRSWSLGGTTIGWVVCGGWMGWVGNIPNVSGEW